MVSIGQGRSRCPGNDFQVVVFLLKTCGLCQTIIKLILLKLLTHPPDI